MPRFSENSVKLQYQDGHDEQGKRWGEDGWSFKGKLELLEIREPEKDSIHRWAFPQSMAC